MKKTVLVLTPHADDETLGMWWTIAKMVNQWHNVTVALFCLTEKDSEIRREEFKSACKVLWCNWIDEPLFGTMDTRLYQIDYKEIVSKIDDMIMDIKPDILFMPENSPHQDHKTVYQATITALRISLQRDYNVPEVYVYDYPPLVRNTEEKTFNIIIDITETAHIKAEAFWKYESQCNDKTRANPEWVIDYARTCGFWRWYRYAERFKMLRKTSDF